MTKHYHLIGIGGIGMSGIARLLLDRGIKVSGSDNKPSKILDELKESGAIIFIGHSAANIDNPDLAIYSSAIHQDNPEILELKKKGIPLIKRAQALAELMQAKEVITVTGSHGKTTTSSMVSYLLWKAGLSPTIAVGGIIRNIDTNAWMGKGNFFVAEADESDGSFLYYKPKYSIITNIDREHLDYYKNFGNAIQAYKDFINGTRFDGCVFYCADDNNLKDIMREYKGRKVSFGLTDSADIYPKNIEERQLQSDFDCFMGGKFVAKFHLSLGGRHNISNALSVIAVALELGIGIEVTKNVLAGYKGAHRRIEVKYEDNDITIIDDYAHHPTEIKATLSALKNLNFKRLIAIFQPHRYSRTQLLWDEFVGCFELVDILLFTDLYAASEPPIEGVSSQALSARIKEVYPKKDVVYLPKGDVCGHIVRICRPGDLIVTLGAGDITKICDDLVSRIKGKN